MVTPKSKRTDLAVPQWVAAEWNKGTREKEQMAATLQEVNWDKALGYAGFKMYSLLNCIFLQTFFYHLNPANNDIHLTPQILRPSRRSLWMRCRESLLHERR